MSVLNTSTGLSGILIDNSHQDSSSTISFTQARYSSASVHISFRYQLLSRQVMFLEEGWEYQSMIEDEKLEWQVANLHSSHKKVLPFACRMRCLRWDCLEFNQKHCRGKFRI
ncbi:hypothetical protein NC652_031180 [Populus alba x Populus x berolinensis]|nr:hypothetical protein NC652_031180 [Populus alba x Populus x berolinensis]